MKTLKIFALLTALQASADSISMSEASRFLSHASLGADYETLQYVADLGTDDWITEQQSIPHAPIRPLAEQFVSENQHIDNIDQRPHVFRFALWNQLLGGSQLLRYRVALALSEIMVISDNVANIRQNPVGMADYYDMLARNAFGNFRTLIEEVTMHPIMGIYLSHAGNAKADPETGSFPDENYAREVMQLFTIGLFELNMDGTRKLDENGEPIPTYDNEDITNFARVFTGITYDFSILRLARGNVSDEAAFELVQRPRFANFEAPMVTVDAFHDTDTKYLLNGINLDPGQSAAADISAALDNLFLHPNTPPFISRLLIQRLSTSNPSPSYIQRVAEVFANNGNGIRGDLGAVVRAILTDPEALRTDLASNHRGKMREPYFTMMRIVRGFNGISADGYYYYYSNNDAAMLGQRPFSSPSVFNFFLPDYSPAGLLADNNLLAPEFQIANTQTLPGTANLIENLLYYDNRSERLLERKMANGNETFQGPYLKPWVLDLDDEIAIASDTNALIDRIALILNAGTLSDQTRSNIYDAIDSIRDAPEFKVKTAIYLVCLSPEFVIQK
ncbi:MAG: DUF1800 domain-containing protein [Opitutales bacterium]|nr:DUF1800 domain-containing protein [Opitutales bacterium]